MPYWLSLLADISARDSRPGAARATLDAALAAGRVRRDVWWLPEAMRMRAACDDERAAIARLLSAAKLASEPLDRAPLPLETSSPGVFAAGDARCRSIKRVASAVGDGATAVRLVQGTSRERMRTTSLTAGSWQLAAGSWPGNRLVLPRGGQAAHRGNTTKALAGATPASTRRSRSVIQRAQ